MIAKRHLRTYRDIFKHVGLEPKRWLVIGVQDIEPKLRGSRLFGNHETLEAYLRSEGVTVDTLDYFDERADYQYDLNQPLPEEMHRAYDVVVDLGNIEHIFDMRRVFINYLSAVQKGGHVVFQNPVAGYPFHGLHTLNPDLLANTLMINGGTILYQDFHTRWGNSISRKWIRWLSTIGVITCVVARMDELSEEFITPQQGKWDEYYQQLNAGTS